MKLIHGWILFSVDRNSEADSTMGRFTEASCFGLSVVLRYYTNAFAMSGPWGEPTATTSICFYKFPSK